MVRDAMVREELAAAGALLLASRLPALEARALLAHQLGIAREQLIARPGHCVSAQDAIAFAQLSERRRQGEPLAYLLAEKEFYGRMFSVTRAVLIPRPETETLVDLALQTALPGQARVLDLGTGSGCIAITLAIERPQWRIVATDCSVEALEVARRNALRWPAARVDFRLGDWFAAVTAGERFDLIVSNPPYVANGDAHLQALRFEPPLALIARDGSSGAGSACLATIIQGAPAHLAPGGTLAVEHGHDQGAAMRAAFTAGDWHNVHTRADLAGLERVTAGTLTV